MSLLMALQAMGLSAGNREGLFGTDYRRGETIAFLGDGFVPPSSIGNSNLSYFSR